MGPEVGEPSDSATKALWSYLGSWQDHRRESIQGFI